MASFDAFGTDCNRCIEIAIPAQAEVLTAFPALIGTPDAAHEFWTTVQADGSDLYFFLADGTALPYELVAIDTGAKTMECYVRVTCSNAATTYVYMLWSGSANAGNTPTDTWSGSYHLVYHGQQGAGNWTDSTANGYTGTNVGVAAGTGKIGVCGDFESTESDYVSNATACNWEYTQAWTVIAWIKPESVSTDATVSGRTTSSGDIRGNKVSFGSAAQISTTIINDNSPVYRVAVKTTDADMTTGVWSMISVTYSGSGAAAGVAIYQNGSARALSTINDTLGGRTVLTAAPYNVGARNNTDTFFDGLIDEVRIATVARSANWVAAEYNNTNDADAWSTQTTVPNIISILPITGTAAGGTDLAITGTGFLAALGAGGLTLGGTACTDYAAHGWTSFTCKSGAHAAGLVGATFTNNDGHDDTLAGAFTYTSPTPPVPPVVGDDLEDLLGTSTLWEIGFDWKSNPVRKIDMSRTLLELSTSRITVLEISDYLAQEVRYSVTQMDASEINALVTFFNGRLGRYRRFWLPVVTRKFTIEDDAAKYATQLVVSDSGFSEFCQGYERIIIYLSDGARVTRGINAATDNGDGTETLDLITPLYRNVSASDVLLCCPLIMARFTQDELALSHVTAHVAEAAVGFRELVREYVSEGGS